MSTVAGHIVLSLLFLQAGTNQYLTAMNKHLELSVCCIRNKLDLCTCMLWFATMEAVLPVGTTCIGPLCFACS